MCESRILGRNRGARSIRYESGRRQMSLQLLRNAVELQNLPSCMFTPWTTCTHAFPRDREVIEPLVLYRFDTSGRNTPYVQKCH